MGDEQAFAHAIHDIQETLNKAERQLARLGRDLQFLVGTGDLEIVRRGPTGETKRPKMVVAELKGCDPMLWRPEHPAWMRSLVLRSWGEPKVAKKGNGQPGSSGTGEEENGGSEPPVSTGGRS